MSEFSILSITSRRATMESLQEEVISEQQDVHIPEKETNSEAETEIDSLPSLEEVEAILGYEFNNKKLLTEAFFHHSFPDKKFSYERLEYVGDSVLNLIFTREQYFRYPDLSPGSLTRLRAANVDTEKLARVAVKHGLYRYLRHNKPLLEEQVRDFTDAIADYPLHSNGLVDVPKGLADIVESVVGAVFIDSGSIDTVWKVFKDLLEPIIDLETIKIHPVTELFEICQKKNLKLRFEDLWRDESAVHVFINDQLVGRGSYAMKKEVAYNRAAKDALDNFKNILSEIDKIEGEVLNENGNNEEKHDDVAN